MNCSICGQDLTETTRYRLYGKDYCFSCQKDVPRQRSGVWDESVRGTVIGGDDTRYEFHCKGGAVKSNYFTSDTKAIEWFKATYPVLYANGAEMRVFDV